MSSQFSKSRERWTGMPGRYSKLEVARNHSSPTRTTLGSGWKPFRTGLYRVVMRVLRDRASGREEGAEICGQSDRAGIAPARPGSSGDRVRERESGVGVDARECSGRAVVTESPRSAERHRSGRLLEHDRVGATRLSE